MDINVNDYGLQLPTCDQLRDCNAYWSPCMVWAQYCLNTPIQANLVEYATINTNLEQLRSHGDFLSIRFTSTPLNRPREGADGGTTKETST